MERKAWFLGIVLGFLVFVVIDMQRVWSDRMNMHREEQAAEIMSAGMAVRKQSVKMPSCSILLEKMLVNDGLSSGGEAGYGQEEKPVYVKAYTEFLSRETIDEGHDFPIRGYYLFDLNFDGIPELGILHDSRGSMGGYFTCYYFDGEGITAILNDRGEPVQISNYTQILADYEQEKVYLLKEMYLLQGNENGTYGYVKEIKREGQIPCVYDILNLEVDRQSDLRSHFGTQYNGEDAFLSAPELEDCLITQRYSGKEWVTVSSSEYLKQKRELIPEENSFVDLRDGDLHYLGANYDGNGDLLYTDVRMGKEEMEELFGRFEQSLK
ncbi:MAG: hypothetical protein NC094_02285 [Bacteroidales bacterium]|nr:hypothetical protein [Lachnoclostridium sp.]MCM1383378.1 hypothetical protein [Lachnoclostridium sp.]MCM1464226.1 hypothetical protein [Bacteroidales bacterium]